MKVVVKFGFKNFVAFLIVNNCPNLKYWLISSVIRDLAKCFLYDSWLYGVLTAFSTVFQLYRGGQCTSPYFPGVLLTSTPHNILSKPMAAFPHNHCRKNRQQWERTDPVAMTIMNPQKGYWPSRGSNQRPPVRKPAMLRLSYGGRLLYNNYT